MAVNEPAASSLHRQNLFYSLGASRSVWENVECKLRNVNFRRVSEPRRAFRPALVETCISDDRYRDTKGVIVISLETRQNAGENFGCTWEYCWTNAGITCKLWEIPGFLWIFIQITAVVIWDSLDVNKQSISLNGEYDAWIIVHYHFWIILAIIFFNIQFLASLHYGTQQHGKRFKYQRRYTETISGLSDQLISNKHGVNVIHSISHFIRSDESRNTKFIQRANQLEALLVFDDYSYRMSGWNWIPMSFGTTYDISQRCNEILSSCNSEWAFERQWLFGWKRGATTREMRRARWGVLYGKEKCTEGVEGGQNEKERQI